MGNSSYENSTEDKNLKEYMKAVIPLLMETWREVAPGRVNNTRNSEGE